MAAGELRAGSFHWRPLSSALSFLRQSRSTPQHPPLSRLSGVIALTDHGVVGSDTNLPEDSGFSKDERDVAARFRAGHDVGEPSALRAIGRRSRRRPRARSVLIRKNPRACPNEGTRVLSYVGYGHQMRQSGRIRGRRPCIRICLYPPGRESIGAASIVGQWRRVSPSNATVMRTSCGSVGRFQMLTQPPP